MGRYTRIPTDAFRKLQINAAILLADFNPEDGSFDAENQLGATSGGVKFSAAPIYADLGAGIDNCPANTKELKRLEGWEAKASGSFVTVDTQAAKALLGAAQIEGETKIVPRAALAQSDFRDIWLVGDYSDLNDAENGGFLAVHLMDALSSGGFQMETGDKAKGQFAFTYLAHYSLGKQETPPFEIYIKAGTAEG